MSKLTLTDERDYFKPFNYPWARLQHGVSKVYQGHRIVLVTWWSNKKEF